MNVHAWERVLPFWYGMFYLLLIFTTILSLRNNASPLALSGAILGLSLLLGLWYGFCMTPFVRYLRSRALLPMGYLLLGWAIWYALVYFDGSYQYLLFGLYPQIFLFRPMPWKILDTFILTFLALWKLLIVGMTDSFLLFAFGTAGGGLILTLFIEAIIRQSRERYRLIHELEETRHELAAAERQAGTVAERQRLAREIHDTLVQGFTSIVMHLEAAEEAIPLAEMCTLRSYLDLARRTARENLLEARRLMWALQPGELEQCSLSEALSSLAHRWSAEHSVETSATLTGTVRPLRPEIEATILRAAQEALTNAGKYAQADRVTLTLSYMEDQIALDVQDNGKGFDTTLQRAEESRGAMGGFGLKALRTRVEQLGGTLSIESALAEGTTIAIALPVIAYEESGI